MRRPRATRALASHSLRRWKASRTGRRPPAGRRVGHGDLHDRALVRTSCARRPLCERDQGFIALEQPRKHHLRRVGHRDLRRSVGRPAGRHGWRGFGEREARGECDGRANEVGARSGGDEIEKARLRRSATARKSAAPSPLAGRSHAASQACLPCGMMQARFSAASRTRGSSRPPTRRPSRTSVSPTSWSHPSPPTRRCESRGSNTGRRRRPRATPGRRTCTARQTTTGGAGRIRSLTPSREWQAETLAMVA